MPTIDPLIINLMFLFVVAFAAWFPCCGAVDPPLDDCPSCTGGGSDNAPFYHTITFSGWANSSCTSCASYDGSYVVAGPAYTTSGYCEWTWSRSTGTNCGTDSETMSLRIGIGYPIYGARVTFTQIKGAAYNLYRWKNTFYDYIDCFFLDYAVAYESRSIGITDSGVSCASSGVTCTITAGN